jgi:hypothetical protein
MLTERFNTLNIENLFYSTTSPSAPNLISPRSVLILSFPLPFNLSDAYFPGVSFAFPYAFCGFPVGNVLPVFSCFAIHTNLSVQFWLLQLCFICPSTYLCQYFVQVGKIITWAKHVKSLHIVGVFRWLSTHSLLNAELFFLLFTLVTVGMV